MKMNVTGHHYDLNWTFDIPFLFFICKFVHVENILFPAECMFMYNNKYISEKKLKAGFGWIDLDDFF